MSYILFSFNYLTYFLLINLSLIYLQEFFNFLLFQFSFFFKFYYLFFQACFPCMDKYSLPAQCTVLLISALFLPHVFWFDIYYFSSSVYR